MQIDAVTETPFRILVLCTGNSARSQIAEAILHTRGLKRPAGVVEAQSAGTKPAAKISEYAVMHLSMHGISWGRHAPKDVKALKDARFDLVITVCDDAQKDCPLYPNTRAQVHWGLPDPAVHISPSTARAAFAATYDALVKRINALLRLPLETMDDATLKKEAQSIHDNLAAPPQRSSAGLRRWR